MTETIDNLVLEQLELIRADLAEMKDDVREARRGLSTLAIGQATIVQHLGHLASSMKQQQVGFDRIGERLERIERRLDLTDAG